MDEGNFSLEQCRECFWQETPCCPRTDWVDDKPVSCDSNSPILDEV